MNPRLFFLCAAVAVFVAIRVLLAIVFAAVVHFAEHTTCPPGARSCFKCIGCLVVDAAGALVGVVPAVPMQGNELAIAQAEFAMHMDHVHWLLAVMLPLFAVAVFAVFAIAHCFVIRP